VNFLRSLTPQAIRVIVGPAIALMIAGFFALQSCQTASTAKTESRLSKGQTGAAIASGADAVETVGDVGARAAESDRLTKENSDAIRSAPGAAVAVDPALDALARKRLCQRPAYRGSEQCLQHAAAK
jgi:hypothetical protein